MGRLRLVHFNRALIHEFRVYKFILLRIIVRIFCFEMQILLLKVENIIRTWNTIILFVIIM
jgi:hypothetical protein